MRGEARTGTTRIALRRGLVIVSVLLGSGLPAVTTPAVAVAAPSSAPASPSATPPSGTPTPPPPGTPQPTPTATSTPTPKPKPASPSKPAPTAGKAPAPSSRSGPDPAHVSAATVQVETLSTQLEGLARRLDAAQTGVEAAQQDAAIALDRYQAQQQASEDAGVRAAAARRSADAATAALRQAREELVAFARSSYIDGSTFPGAASLFDSFTSGRPDEYLERSVLLGAAGNDRADVLQQVTTLQQQTARAEAAARAAAAAAAAAQKRAATALTAAEQAEELAREQRAALAAAQTALRQQLAARQKELAGLIGPAAAAAVVAHAQKVVAGHPGGPPVALPVLLGNRTFAGAGSATAAQNAIAAALARVGTPYAWGGGGAAGPGPGLPPDAGVVGFDCSGLTQYAYARAGIALPRNSRAQYAALPKVATRNLRPGDLVFWAKDPSNPDTIHHVALYLGDGQVLQSPESGEVVTVSPIWWDGYAGAVRPTA